MTLEQGLAAGGAWALPIAALGGLIAGMNPCCLALYPAVTATCCGGAVTGQRVVPVRAGLFVTGTAVATTILGVAAAVAGHAVALLGRAPRYALAFVPIVMGLHLLSWLPLPLPSGDGARWRGGGALAAFGAGLLLSLVLGACGTPVLAAILSVAAYKGSVAFGALLLFVYGIANGLPLLLLGTGVSAGMARLGSTARHAWADRLAGVLLLLLGFYLLLRI